MRALGISLTIALLVLTVPMRAQVPSWHLSATVAEQIEALRRVAGQNAVDLIRRVPDETVARIVGGWAERVDATRATALGFTAETDFDQIIQAYLDDDAPA